MEEIARLDHVYQYNELMGIETQKMWKYVLIRHIDVLREVPHGLYM